LAASTSPLILTTLLIRSGPSRSCWTTRSPRPPTSSTLLSLEHPDIPAIYGYWTAQATAGPFYLVMEYIPGQTLQQELQDAGGRVGWPQVVTWGIALGEVLAYLHSRTPPVIFRDIKPPNVLLDRRTNRPVLIGFGIARQLAQARGTRIGTPGYAPYEQWLGCAEPRSDLYALGALLHTLLTGRSPEAEYIRLRRSGLDVEGAIRALFPPRIRSCRRSPQPWRRCSCGPRPLTKTIATPMSPRWSRPCGRYRARRGHPPAAAVHLRVRCRRGASATGQMGRPCPHRLPPESGWSALIRASAPTRCRHALS
jgi:serine/threonine protein kinase